MAQKKLEDEFLALGYYYERKNKQHDDKSDLPVVDAELMGQIYLSYYLDMPSEARNQKSIVFGDKYEDIFNTNVSAKKMLIPYEIYKPLESMKREIQGKKRRKEAIQEETAFISRAVFHIINAVKVIAEIKGINIYDIEAVKSIIPEAIDRVGEAVKEARRLRGDVYTHDKFFKEKPTNDFIRHQIMKNYQPKP